MEAEMVGATIAGVVVAGVFGLGGLVVGIIGLSQARGAKRAAAEANKIAGKSNKIAGKSNKIAREANDIARQMAARQDELHDVAWEWTYDKDRPGTIRIMNIGKNKAYGVRAQFIYTDLDAGVDVTEANDEPEDVEGRQVLALHVAELGEAILARRQYAKNSASVAMLGNPMAALEMYWTRLRVTWRTTLGTPKQYDSGDERQLGYPS